MYKIKIIFPNNNNNQTKTIKNKKKRNTVKEQINHCQVKHMTTPMLIQII